MSRRALVLDGLCPQTPREHNSNENSEHNEDLPSQKTRREHPQPRKSWHPRSYHKVQDDLLKKPDSALEALLQHMADKQPNLRHTTQVLRLLIRDRHIRPTARHYKALILANTDCERGSPDIVRGLLREMEENGITADSGTLHGALQVLAVHPDYLLRQEILCKLRDRWLTLSPAGWHFVVAGLLRENQIELALEQAALMGRKDIFIENWLHGMIIYTLCDHHEFHEVFDLMCARVDQGHDMSNHLWAHVLTTASEALHHPCAHFVWRRMVELGYMHPPAEICHNVLKVASKLGDTELSMSVFRYLSENNIKLGQGQHEQFVEAHVSAGDLPAAFEALCSMHESGTPLADSSTEAILAYMIEHKTDHREAWQILKRLKNEKRSIPLGAVRVIAQFCEHNAHEDPSVVDDAVGFYKELYTLCPEGADVRIYNVLIRMCRIAKDRQSGMFLVKEMASLGVVPNALTFESIILMCVDAGNFRSGFMYFQDLIKRDAKISPETQKEILEICSGSVDEFAMRLQYHPLIRADVQKLDDEIKQQEEKWEEMQASGEPIHPAVRRMNMSHNERIEVNKERRRKKRRLMAIARKEGRAESGESDESPENGLA
ncbi:uncharacterized protein N7511_007603 [Penicillium nucicola]|uniref:uncharacterized protein n=1 Tax=Penicillium nucicola TaxID=1850975 RepID=UPI00254512EB|nr:uncharacterized protein N7511_007603 [Penicillium nucicola]KAJ5753450.1 hypothetical protein N7511_007603 [Penicillium nucicola]